ncbi:MAG TPA: hypothetical protein VFQ31_08335 [Methyloceanibacter sp.]|nr:hypothetical protein [Methyloceanibacter sp.]
MDNFDVIKSPFLRKVIERRGINDDQVTSLLIVERYQRGTLSPLTQSLR